MNSMLHLEFDNIIAAQTKVDNMLTSLDLVLFFEPWMPVATQRVFARKTASYSYVFGFPFDFDGWGF